LNNKSLKLLEKNLEGVILEEIFYKKNQEINQELNLLKSKLYSLQESNGKSFTKEGIEFYLHNLKNRFNEKIDTLILGCTHYPLLKEAISKIYPNIKIVDPAKETALDLKEILKENKFLKNDAQKNEEVKYYVTDGKEKFKEIGIMFLKENIPTVELIKL